MKAKDLMIGDIVSVTPSSMLIRIAAIHRKKVAYHACNNSFSWVRVGLLQPILLTPEILKKNFPSTTDWYFIGTDKFCFRIDKYKDKWDLYFGRDGKGTNLQIKINYIHELQHALRLCGINKEIII